MDFIRLVFDAYPHLGKIKMCVDIKKCINVMNMYIEILTSYPIHETSKPVVGVALFLSNTHERGQSDDSIFHGFPRHPHREHKSTMCLLFVG